MMALKLALLPFLFQIRMSVGLEEAQDLIDDLDQALKVKQIEIIIIASSRSIQFLSSPCRLHSEEFG